MYRLYASIRKKKPALLVALKDGKTSNMLFALADKDSNGYFYQHIIWKV